jgi:outer membrane protein assembly factor BamD (BamD/ComL family)
MVWVVLLLSACATDEKDATAKMSPEEMYAEAKDIMKGNIFDKAIVLLDKLEGRAGSAAAGGSGRGGGGQSHVHPRDSRLRH